MIGKISVAITLAALSGCAFATKTYAPDGRQAFSISCDGLANSWGKCFQKAGAICRDRGYDTFTQSSDGGVLVSATPQVATGSTLISRNLLIACKGDPSVKPTVP